MNYNIFNIGKIRRYLDKSSTEILINSVVTSKMDYCNSLLYGINNSLINQIQRCQNNAARVMSLTRKYDHVTSVLHSLHWLPVNYRIIYKILIITHKSLYDNGPLYLKNLLSWYSPERDLRSGSQFLLNQPVCRLKSFGARRFEYAAPRLWNDILPIELRNQTDLNIFKSGLKTCLFKLAYPMCI